MIVHQWTLFAPAGLIYTAGAIWNVLQKLNIPIHVQEVGDGVWGWQGGGACCAFIGLRLCKLPLLLLLLLPSCYR